eukprot:4016748-Heterocapsa_arctica.AAC.1
MGVGRNDGLDKVIVTEKYANMRFFSGPGALPLGRPECVKCTTLVRTLHKFSTNYATTAVHLHGAPMD